MFFEVILVAYVLIALALIGIILIQQGKGADMGASFGAGASNTVFGSSGSGNFLTRSTAILATLFFVLSLILGAQSTYIEKQDGEFENLEVPMTQPADEDVPASAESNDTKSSDIPD